MPFSDRAVLNTTTRENSDNTRTLSKPQKYCQLSSLTGKAHAVLVTKHGQVGFTLYAQVASMFKLLYTLI